MFDNICGKIKTMAQAICALGIIGSVIGGIVLISVDMVIVGIIVLIGGSLLSWLGSFGLYGFGQLIENTDILVAQGKKNYQRSGETEKNDGVPVGEKYKEDDSEQNVDNKISEEMSQNEIENDNSETEVLDSDSDEFVDVYCPECGKMLSFTKEYIRQSPFLFCPHCGTKIAVHI